MDDSEKKIFTDSNKIISKLQLLSTYFEDEVIYKIFVRTQVIHKLFESNPEIDSYKLNLYHLQFTESVLELLRRIKKANEKNASLILDEIALNNELIENLTNSMESTVSFDSEKKRHTIKINLALKNLYQNLSDLSTDYPFKNTQKFGIEFARDYFNEISRELFEDLSTFNPSKVYQNDFAIIDRKLMGMQCQHAFSNEFIIGLKNGVHFLEVFKLPAENIYFIFNPERNKFLIIDFTKVSSIEPIQSGSRKEKVVLELRNKNNELSFNLSVIKTQIPEEVKTLLNDYYQKIKGIDFLDFIDDLDVQTNILKAMLDTKTM